jgi:HSP20 family molecular chaperone IbpA
MTRYSLFDSPLLLGFDQLERMVERAAKAGSNGYPPYNIEQIGENGLRITLAVAGFTMDQLQVSLEDRHLVIRGKQEDEAQERLFLHRGIATRQFQRVFLLADEIEIKGAHLDNGLLHIDLFRHLPEKKIQTIAIQPGAKLKSRAMEIDGTANPAQELQDKNKNDTEGRQP